MNPGINFLFVYTQLGLGGIESLIIKFSDWFINHGHYVNLILLNKSEVDKELNNSVKVKYVDNTWKFFNPLHKDYKKTILKNVKVDIVISFDPLSLWMTALIANLIKDNPKFITGVYHPNIYFFSKKRRIYNNLTSKLFLNYVNDNSKIWMNKAVQTSHEKFFNKKFDESKIFPFPIKFNNKEFIHTPKKYKIVSVGRLTIFKTYNLYLIDIIKEIGDNIPNIEWHVYGEGELKDEMLRKIREKKLDDKIFLHGKIENEMVPNILEDCYLFIGMGATIIEAGYFGIPSIPAIVYSDKWTYGYIYDLPEYTVGEIIENKEKVSVKDLIYKLCQMSEDEYHLESEKTKSYCKKFDIDKVSNLFFREIFPNVGLINKLRNVPFYVLSILFLDFLKFEVINKFKNKVFEILKKILPTNIYIYFRDFRRKRIISLRFKEEERIGF